MGAASTLLLFDARRHLEVSVPALETWIDSGHIEAWWGALIARDRCAELRDVDRQALAEWPGFSRAIRLAAVLPARARSIIEDSTRSAIEVAFLSSVREGVCFGNAASLILAMADLDPELEALSRPVASDSAEEPRAPFARCVARLDAGLNWLAHSSGGFGEGLRGALTPVDVRALWEALPAEHVPHGCADRSDVLQSRHVSHEAAALSAIAVMGRLAAERGLGLLHGRELALEGFGHWESGLWNPGRPLSSA